MIEYIFFDTSLRDDFVAYTEGQGIACSQPDDHMGYVVAVPEDIGDALEDALEARYQELERQQAQLLAAEAGGLSQLAGIRLELADGRSRLVPLDTAIASRLLAAFTLDEIQDLFATVARTVLEPGEDHLCGVLAARKCGP